MAANCILITLLSCSGIQLLLDKHGHVGFALDSACSDVLRCSACYLCFKCVSLGLRRIIEAHSRWQSRNRSRRRKLTSARWEVALEMGRKCKQDIEEESDSWGMNGSKLEGKFVCCRGKSVLAPVQILYRVIFVLQSLCISHSFKLYLKYT